MRIAIIGGGWAGCAAAVLAASLGAETVLVEKNDILLGSGNSGGIMNNNGRYTAAREAVLMGAGTLFWLIEQFSLFNNVNFVDHHHASLYDTTRIEPAVRELLHSLRVVILTETRVTDARFAGGRINALLTSKGNQIAADAFVETTGTAGPMKNCAIYGNGCVMCQFRCQAFGPRVSLTAKIGLTDLATRREDGTLGAMSGSCKLDIRSVGYEVQQKLHRGGVAIIPLPDTLIDEEKAAIKVCQQYRGQGFVENLVLLNTGNVKLMTPYFPLRSLRRVKGLERAVYVEPYGASKGNSMRFFSMALRDNTLRVSGAENLFCAGEKAGPFVGHTEAIITGTLAAYNVVRLIAGKELLVLPEELCMGDMIRYVGERVRTKEGLSHRYSLSGSHYFERMVKRGLYTTEEAAIRSRVKGLGLQGVFERI